MSHHYLPYILLRHHNHKQGDQSCHNAALHPPRPTKIKLRVEKKRKLEINDKVKKVNAKKLYYKSVHDCVKKPSGKKHAAGRGIKKNKSRNRMSREIRVECFVILEVAS